MRRIAVFGPSGSGKTTVARQIGGALGLPVDEFRAKVGGALSGHGDGWVCDGNYAMVRPLVLPSADTVVWLRLPFPTVYLRLVRRTVTRAWRRELLWDTNRESWRMSFLSRDSILLWGLTHWRAHHRGVAEDLRELPHQARVIELRSDGEVARFLHGLHRGMTAPERSVVTGEAQ